MTTENARHENVAPLCRDGTRKAWKFETKSRRGRKYGKSWFEKPKEHLVVLPTGICYKSSAVAEMGDRGSSWDGRPWPQ